MLEDCLLTAAEVAEILKISKNTVYELIKRGDLAACKISNKMRIELSAVEEYKNKSRSSVKAPTQIANKHTVTKQNQSEGMNLKRTSSLYKEKDNISEGANENGSEIIICGQDGILDILSRHLECCGQNIKALRSYVGSYNALNRLYMGSVQVATSHLWDSATNSYNLPYIEKLVPGINTTVIHMVKRKIGFYVAKGNPKQINGWEDLRHKDIIFVNREKGSGARILLDQKLKQLGIVGEYIEGYQNECTSHLATASTVARGEADVAIGTEKHAMSVKGIDFIPLQVEEYDLVLKTADLEKPYAQAIMEILNSDAFKSEVAGLGNYDIKDLGKIKANL